MFLFWTLLLMIIVDVEGLRSVLILIVCVICVQC